MVDLTRRAALVGLSALALCLTTRIPFARADESAPAVIQTFYAGLIDVMKQATALGFEGRVKKLEPLVDASYDLPLMTRITVGLQWNTLTPEQQDKVKQSFRAYTIATYASRFDGYSGERFDVSPTTEPSQGSDLIVSTKLVLKAGDPIELNYLMRNAGAGWRIIDVFLSGTISELATRRSEFSAVLRRDGIDGLINTLNDHIKEMQSRPKG
jgi:phospholipid transport system substrate-binding protein